MYCTFCEKTGEASKLKSKLMLFWRLLSRRSLPKRRSRQSQRLPSRWCCGYGTHVLATGTRPRDVRRYGAGKNLVSRSRNDPKPVSPLSQERKAGDEPIMELELKDGAVGSASP